MTSYSEVEPPTTRLARSRLRGRVSGVLDADSVIDRVPQLLFAPETFLSSLDRRMTEQELHLLRRAGLLLGHLIPFVATDSGFYKNFRRFLDRIRDGSTSITRSYAGRR